MNFYLKFKHELEKRHLWEVFIYLFFGGLTTLVNIIIYFIFREWIKTNYIIANIIANMIAILFAFITNKVWVFHSRTENIKELIVEFSKFVFYRLLSFGLDMISMMICIDMLQTGDLFAKLFTQVLVVIANYLFSKLFIFKSKDKVV
ncbi:MULTISPECIES: GtrA family protein [Enterococcus]|uniref:GtrA family protein n=1 Tax=Enterococcus TaxID=1350 RepID=UPI0026EF13FD|nr:MULTISPECIES: GtrA family protein [Enterococcus]MDT2738585.1 GtrA family protein [Enterococcus canintestini]